MCPGHPKKIDHEYVRKGVADIFLAVEPLVDAVTMQITEKRTRKELAEFIKHLAEDIYPYAKKLVLVMDNLNTHDIASLYAAYPPEQAQKLARCLEIHHTPKHGSWLNIAEIELSALSVQCLDRIFEDISELKKETAAWEQRRNQRQTPINWQFRT
jgi:hypothetical protein